MFVDSRGRAPRTEKLWPTWAKPSWAFSAPTSDPDRPPSPPSRAALDREEQDLSVLFVHALIDSFQQTQNMTLQLLPTCTSTKGNSCLNQQQEVTRLVPVRCGTGAQCEAHLSHANTQQRKKASPSTGPPQTSTNQSHHEHSELHKKNFERRHEGNSFGFCFLLLFFVVFFLLVFFHFSSSCFFCLFLLRKHGFFLFSLFFFFECFSHCFSCFSLFLFVCPFFSTFLLIFSL